MEYQLERASVITRLWAAGCVFAEEEAAILLAEADDPVQVDQWVQRRQGGEPLEYIVGWAEFDGIRVGVDHGVFVPRVRTQAVVDEAFAALTDWAATPPVAGSEAAGETAGPGDPARSIEREWEHPVVVDLCCGSGAVGLALARRWAALGHDTGGCPGPIELYAIDVERHAIACARKNLAGAGRVLQGDLYEPLPRTLQGKVRVISANAPYVPTPEIALMPSEARDYEPLVTLDGGDDGVELHREIARQAPAWLCPGGALVIETSRRQATATSDAFTRAGLIPQVRYHNEVDAVVVVGRAGPAPATPPARSTYEIRTRLPDGGADSSGGRALVVASSPVAYRLRWPVSERA